MTTKITSEKIAELRGGNTMNANMEKVREALNVGVEDLENPPSFDDMRKSITKALQLLAAEQESAAPKLLT